jgi:hypothetical protein
LRSKLNVVQLRLFLASFCRFGWHLVPVTFAISLAPPEEHRDGVARTVLRERPFHLHPHLLPIANQLHPACLAQIQPVLTLPNLHGDDGQRLELPPVKLTSVDDIGVDSSRHRGLRSNQHGICSDGGDRQERCQQFRREAQKDGVEQGT